MNSADISNLEGRELDEAVAQHVMGWKIIEAKDLPRNHWPWRKADGEYTYALPAYSTDLYAAWEVVEKMREYNMAFHAKGWIKTSGVEVRFSDWYAENGGNGKIAYAIASTPERAICRAALRGVIELRVTSRFE